MSANGSANGSANCYNFTKVEVEAAYYTKISVASLGILLSFVVVVLFCISKVCRGRFVFRLVFYLMLLNLFEATILLLEVIPAELQDGEVFIRPNWGGVCSLFGFIDQIISWMGFIAIVWIMLYMLWLTYHLYKIQDGQQHENSHAPKVSKKVEMIGILTLLITPFVLNWIPFIWDMYGLSGPWCWIKGTQNSCGNFALGVTLMILLFYGPVVMIVLFSFISFIIIVIFIIRAASKLRGGNRKKANRFIREMLLIISYPLIYNTLCIILLANRIKEATLDKDEPPFFPLWMAEAIADPARVVLLPLAFILHPKSWKNMFSKQERYDFMDDEYNVPPEDDDIDEGITIRGTKMKESFAYGALLEPQTFAQV